MGFRTFIFARMTDVWPLYVKQSAEIFTFYITFFRFLLDLCFKWNAEKSKVNMYGFLDFIIVIAIIDYMHK